ncbi:copper-binding protein [Paraburkholderia sp. D15]|uniref:copper-binding protein n=1 Tax=Paraburkholderia sp. D15 TaxID=2880218 RepID=UPI0024798877|nr:copper-binding protein [Paraburkholderia sp. D15]WGS52089.1 copper-binding protein [Paraburkholderia sp. D15]
MKTIVLSAIFAAAAAASTVAFADDMPGMKMTGNTMSHADASAPATNGLTDAVVKRVDPSSGMIMLKHGALTNVGMPAMTMAFKAKDAAMLKDVKEGDNVKVRIEDVNDTLTIVKLVKQ